MDDWMDLDVFQFAIVTVLPAKVKNAEELEFNETNVTKLFNEKNYKAHMCVRIKSKSLQPAVSVFNTSPGPNLICRFFPPQMGGLHPPLHNMILLSASNSPVHVMSRVILLVQLGDLHVHVFFSAVDNVVVPQFLRNFSSTDLSKI